MPGYVIHLAVAKEYLKKSKNRNENEEEFINGVIFPDSVKDKAITHYGEKSSKSNLYEFLKDKNVNNSFNRGYFLHLLTDYLFYNKYVDRMTKDMYNDYDITNKKLIDKYNVELPNEIKGSVFFKEGDLQILSYDLLYKMIVENYIFHFFLKIFYIAFSIHRLLQISFFYFIPSSHKKHYLYFFLAFLLFPIYLYFTPYTLFLQVFINFLYTF